MVADGTDSPCSRPPDVSEAAWRAHDQAMAAGEPTYLDPLTGYVVLTADHLRAQGACCGSGCRHCPFDAAEQRRAGRPTTT